MILLNAKNLILDEKYYNQILDLYSIFTKFDKLIMTYIKLKAIFENLPENHIISGLSEVYKHSIIGDRTLWDYLKSNPKKLDYNYIIERSFILKSKIVEKDPNENNIRKKLQSFTRYL